MGYVTSLVRCHCNLAHSDLVLHMAHQRHKQLVEKTSKLLLPEQQSILSMLIHFHNLPVEPPSSLLCINFYGVWIHKGHQHGLPLKAHINVVPSPSKTLRGEAETSDTLRIRRVFLLETKGYKYKRIAENAKHRSPKTFQITLLLLHKKTGCTYFSAIRRCGRTLCRWLPCHLGVETGRHSRDTTDCSYLQKVVLAGPTATGVNGVTIYLEKLMHGMWRAESRNGRSGGGDGQ
jgi:hypothetical protein